MRKAAKPGARSETHAKERAVVKYIRAHSLTPSTSSRASRCPTTSTTSDEPGASCSEEVTPKSS